MKVSDYVAQFLESKNITHVFELSGGMITHLLDSLQQKTKIHIVTMHHEQSAAFAADAMGRVKGIPGVALATSGPGATNLLTGIGSCYFDSSPAIFITGQVNTHEQKGDRNIRQLGFQETDIVSMAKPITKAAFLINNPNDIPEILEKAYQISLEGRPGPVLLDIPMNVQRAQIELSVTNINTAELHETHNEAILHAVVEAFKNASKPLVLVGRGIRAAYATELLQSLVQQTKWPVVTSLLAVDAIPHHHPQRVGFIGSYGNRWANVAFGECDCLLVLGSRLDIRQTGADTAFFENRTIFHVDCEPDEINNRVKGCVSIVADVKVFLKQLVGLVQNQVFVEKSLWINQIQELKAKWPDTAELDTGDAINPNVFMRQLSESANHIAAYLADVGSHQMWAAQSLSIHSNQLFLTSAGMGAMGFALPASIGACLALNKQPVVVIIGDGCMQLNIQELQTILRNKLPIKIVVMNNENLGMIRQFQDSYFESRYQSTYWGYSAPNFETIANAYGIQAKTISTPHETKQALEWLHDPELHNLPQLLQVMVNPYTNTYPKIAFGRPITEMEPFVKPVDMEGT